MRTERRKLADKALRYYRALASVQHSFAAMSLHTRAVKIGKGLAK